LSAGLIMDMKRVIKRIIAKLEEKKELENKKLSKEEAFDILYKFIKREDLTKPNISKVVKIDKEGVSALRKIYDNAKVEQKYSYGYEKFGFFLEDIRVDVDPAHLEIRKIKQ